MTVGSGAARGLTRGPRETFATPGMQWISVGSGIYHAEGGGNERGEVERGYFWVYQEAETPDAIRDYGIWHAVLMDAIPRQSNRVNVKLHDEIKTLVFNGSPGPQRVAFD